MDLLSVLGTKMPGVDFTRGTSGFPSYDFDDDEKRKRVHNVKVAAKVVFPKPLSETFAIKVLFKPYVHDAGILFAVVNPYQTIIQFGLGVRDAGKGKQDIVLYYTPSPSTKTVSEVIANFTVDSMRNRWTQMNLKVDTNTISLYLNCKSQDDIAWTRRVSSLDFELGSTLYLGQAGPQLNTLPKFRVCVFVTRDGGGGY